MSRDIKFRAWYESEERMIPWGELEVDEELSHILNDDLADVSPAMQFTGLEDKNGVEIFEGDIFPNHFSSKILGVVRFGEYTSMNDDNHGGHVGFFIDWNDGNLLRKDLAYWIKVSHVIGNIHENPELMEVSKC